MKHELTINKIAEGTSTMTIQRAFIRLAMGLALVCSAVVSTHADAATSRNTNTNSDDEDISSELNNLGNNQQVKDRAAQLDSRTRVGIVQGRAVDRNWRFEVGVDYGAAGGGDSYLNTQNAGVNLDLHIIPQISLGVHYAKVFNQLSNEGQQQFSNARANGTDTPQISYGEQSVMAVIDWYMTYGKINLFDWKTVQFDVYTLAGYGEEQVLTQTGSASDESWTPTWTAGVGIGFWLTNHCSLRGEIRYQTYQDQDGSRNLNLVVGTVGLGFLI